MREHARLTKGASAAPPAHTMGETVRQPYLDLRAQARRRDRSLHEKVVSLEEAASLVKDGETWASAAARCRARRWP